LAAHPTGILQQINFFKKYLTTLKIMFMFPQESGPAQTGYDTGKRFSIVWL